MIKDYTNKNEVESASVERLGGIRAALDDWTYDDDEDISKTLNFVEEACIAIVNECMVVDPDNSHDLECYLEDMQTTIPNTDMTNSRIVEGIIADLDEIISILENN